MEKKGLPIGTVCSIKNDNRQVMIVGYCNVSLDNDVKLSDYSAVIYPYGFNCNSSMVSFNESDIVNISFLGYETNESLNLLNKIKSINFNYISTKINDIIVIEDKDDDFDDIVIDKVIDNTPVVETKTPVIAGGFIFDEDGYLVKEDSTKFENPFKKEEIIIPEVKLENEPDKWEIFKNIQFDENGFVISDGQDEVSQKEIVSNNEVEVNQESGSLEDTNSINNNNNFQSIKFDENGYVVSDGLIENNDNSSIPKPNEFGKIKFDENGYVIDDGSSDENEELNVLEPTKFGKIKFDENGYVVSDGNDEVSDDKTSNKDKLQSIQFDENGYVISE